MDDLWNYRKYEVCGEWAKPFATLHFINLVEQAGYNKVDRTLILIKFFESFPEVNENERR